MKMVEPNDTEETIALRYLQRPWPHDRSPIRHLAMLLAGYREALFDEFEMVARRVEPDCAAEIRGCIERLRGKKGPTT